MLAFSPYHALLRSQLVADDASYLTHGFTLGLDFNLAYRTILTKWLASSGHLPAHPMGPGILAAPFISLFSMIDRILDLPVINDHHQYLYSWSLFGFVFASNFYFIFGLFLYHQGLKALRLQFNSKWLILFACSFGVLYYVLFRPIMGHAFEFFTLALCFWSTARWYELTEMAKKPAWWLYGLGALSMVLTIEVRPANLNVLMLPFIILITMSLLRNPLSLRRFTQTQLSFMFKLAVALLLVFMPFWLMHYQLYGVIMPSSQDLYGVRPSTMPPLQDITQVFAAIWTLVQRLPQIFTIAFSSEFGLLYTSPIILIGPLCFLYWLVRHKFSALMLINSILILMYCGLPVAIILFWQSPGDAYAYRFLFCLFPIALLGYAVFDHVYRLKSVQYGLISLSGLALLANLFFALSPQLMYHDDAQNTLGLRGGSARGYNQAVIQAAVSPQIWTNLVATRFPGFMALGLVKSADIELNKLPVPHQLNEKWQKILCCYTFPPIRIYMQSLLLAIFFVGSLLWLSRQPKSN